MWYRCCQNWCGLSVHIQPVQLTLNLEFLSICLIAPLRTTLYGFATSSLQLIQHPGPEDTNVGIDRNHIKSLLRTIASIISISA